MQETWEMQVQEDPLKKGSNLLQYSWLEDLMEEEPGGLQSIGSQRIKQDWSDLAPTHAEQSYIIGFITHILWIERVSIVDILIKLKF